MRAAEVRTPTVTAQRAHGAATGVAGPLLAVDGLPAWGDAGHVDREQVRERIREAQVRKARRRARRRVSRIR